MKDLRMNDNPNKPGRNILLSWDEDEVQIASGSSKTIRLKVTNQGNDDDYYEINIKGLSNDWIAIDSPVVKIRAREQRQIELTITIQEPPYSRSGRYPFEAQMTSQGNPDVSATISRVLNVAAFQTEERIGILLESVQFSVSPGSPIIIPLVLHNRGLAADTFVLDVDGIPWPRFPLPTCAQPWKLTNRKKSSLLSGRRKPQRVQPGANLSRSSYTVRKYQSSKLKLRVC